ncbi:MAG: MGH1-like glycoside hydrolase domain-containing protein [Bryobacteraceae bacterium]
MNPERRRLAEADSRQKHWRRFGPYLADRSWGTVREDYSANGDAWDYLPHEHSRSRAYRWTEDGILGICDNHQYLCFALAVWNGKDPILKERFFGLTGKEGNHGEDVKEIYYYLDATPTASYLKGLYKYPQTEFPYAQLVAENRKRTRFDREYDLNDTGIFDQDRYFDIFVEYAKRDFEDIFIRVTVVNRGPDPASLTVMPTLWFRNTWSWGRTEQPDVRPNLRMRAPGQVEATHATLGTFVLTLDGTPQTLFTDNETNYPRVFGINGTAGYVKDAFHDYIVERKRHSVNPLLEGTKACAVHELTLAPEENRSIYLRLARGGIAEVPRENWDGIFSHAVKEADEFYREFSSDLAEDAANVQRQAFGGLFWSKQYYHFVVDTWLKGDENAPPPPTARKCGRNHRWVHLFNEDVILMPDKWEYPWYAAWDLAFHTVAVAPADPGFAKAQLSLFVREWYMHPNGQLPAYEWSFSDVNPPVHAWAAWRVFQIDRRITGKADLAFLERVFHKLLMNFTWWVNRKDSAGANVFEGGFLGLDNIGIFDRSAPLPQGWLLEQSDASSWMGMYCLNMLKIALQLAGTDSTYEDIASKFFEHFLYIAHAVNCDGGTGLWDEEDGFYYDRLRFAGGERKLLRVHSLVGLLPLLATDTMEFEQLAKHPGFQKRMQWFIDNRPDLTEGLAPLLEGGVQRRRLLSLVTRERMDRILKRVLDSSEFLSPYGVRSVSRYHKDHPYTVTLNNNELRIDYEPAESQTTMFGGNSNWRGPVWFPMNFLLIEALQRLDYYYGDSFTVECPTGSGNHVPLRDVARHLSQSLTRLFLRGENGRRPIYGDVELFQENPQFRDYIFFYEHFEGDDGSGLGASHQTGWTGLVAKLLQQSGAAPVRSDRPGLKLRV